MTTTVRVIRSWLAKHSVTLLRISLGLVILGFGVLKYFPGISPAEPLVMRTVDALTFGMLTGTPAVVTTAVVETVLGLILLTGKGLDRRTAHGRLADRHPGPRRVVLRGPVSRFRTDARGPVLLKDLILVAAGAVVAAQVLGARYTIGGDR